jgi:hypothetical protein
MARTVSILVSFVVMVLLAFVMALTMPDEP